MYDTKKQQNYYIITRLIKNALTERIKQRGKSNGIKVEVLDCSLGVNKFEF